MYLSPLTVALLTSSLLSVTPRAHMAKAASIPGLAGIGGYYSSCTIELPQPGPLAQPHDDQGQGQGERKDGEGPPLPLAAPSTVEIATNASLEVLFRLPADTPPTLCSLVARFPRGWPIVSRGNPAIDVVALRGHHHNDDDNDDDGDKNEGLEEGGDYIIGTTVLRHNPTTPGGVTTINNFACDGGRPYRFRLQMEGLGSVRYVAARGVGIMMAYDC